VQESPSAEGYWIDPDGTFHENYTALIFVGQEFLGEFPWDPGAHPETRWRRFGTAYFCQVCGEVWGRVVFQDSSGRQLPFQVDTVACAEHTDQWEVPGSLLAGDLEGLLGDLPLRAVAREFRVHIKHLGE
jgi:hypothetical protein